MLFTITTTGKVVLLLVACSFIAFALVTAMVLPKRVPGFPGRHLGAFITFTVLFFAAQMTAVWWVTGTQEVEKESEAVAETMPVPTETTTPETAVVTGTEPAGGEGDAAAGKEVFAAAGCGGCHTLADAGASGTVGPNFDETMPSYELAVDRVTNGKGVMRSFSGSLDEIQIADVATYVSSVAGR